MGKIFEALYGNQQEKEKVAASSGDTGVAEADSAAIPSDERLSDTNSSQAASFKNIALPMHPMPKVNEKWRRDLKKVASNLMVTLDGSQLGGKVLMFTGMESKVGVSTVVESIANMLATEYNRHRVLILDFAPVEGMADSLLGQLNAGCKPDSFIEAHYGDEVTRISVGALKDSLGSKNAIHQLRDFLAVARSHYDWVLLDAPPFNHAPFGDSLGRMSDGVALVVNIGVTRVPALNAIEEDMAQLGINLVGIILNFRKYPLPKRLLRFL